MALVTSETVMLGLELVWVYKGSVRCMLEEAF